jgi:hypothetical protein
VVVKLSNLAGRDNFGAWLNRRGLTGEAVEVGTHQGVFASCLLETWRGKILWCVDPWISGYDPQDPASRGDRQEDERLARERLAPYLERGRAKILRETSLEAANRFEPDSLDFSYIDACHQYPSVSQDLRIWWRLVRRGGVVAGHDIISMNKPGEGWDQYVEKAVRDFVEELGKNAPVIWLVPELPRRNWSFYLVKP